MCQIVLVEAAGRCYNGILAAVMDHGTDTEPMPREGRLAFPLEGVDAIVASHNIAGSHGVLNAAGDQLEHQISRHYASRGIDHIPFTGDPHIRAYVLTPDPDHLRPHAFYRQQLAGIPFTPTADLHELNQQGVKKALFLPYIRLYDDPLPEGIEWIRYGLPPNVTIRLKDKVYMHRWMVQHGFGAYVPNFIGCDAAFLPRFGLRMLREIAKMLEALGMRDRYPLGLMIRGALSDGNYAMAAVVEALHPMEFNGLHIKKGQFMLKPNGKAVDLEVFDTAEQALERVKNHIRRENNPDVDDRVVMSRLLDIDTSPGLCAAITGGELHQFPFNGQYMEPGDTACTGTWTYSSAVGEEKARYVSSFYLNQAQELLQNILNRFFDGYPLDQLYAMLNMDVMIIGGLERELYERAQRTLEHHNYLDNIGCVDRHYLPRVYDPNRVLFAEINPRDTNWTIAMKAVLQVLNLPCTVENMKMLADGKHIQVLALDHWRLPEGISLDDARHLLLEFHHRLQPNGEGFILRMSDNPAGIILYTRSPRPERLRELSQEAYQFLAEHKPMLLLA